MKRNEFLKLSGGLALAGLASKSGFASFTGEAAKLKNFGIQLWSVRDDLAKNPKEVLKQLASYGYTQIESFEGKSGMFWGMTNTEFKTYMDQLGMKIISSHCDINKDFEKKAAEAAAIGMKYLICPYKGPQKDLDAFRKFAEEFNQKGEICKKNGIRFAYHNHDYSFATMNGEMGQDIMMKNTDPKLVDFELDMYWVVAAGQDIEAWLKKYPTRFRLCHVKDRKKGAPLTDKDESVVVGTGSINYPKILKTAKKYGMEYYIVEQEKWEGTTPMQAAQADAVYMKTLSI
ncbi:MAG TPA: sugar phosphate isomerase/epimerase [Chitinophagaceae bacterium]|jgi:sugar phosphate isomerase/epimerase|nr:sugar phosphate isomerase/epimerase [Chitinophagaceae bacterium]